MSKWLILAVSCFSFTMVFAQEAEPITSTEEVVTEQEVEVGADTAAPSLFKDGKKGCGCGTGSGK